MPYLSLDVLIKLATHNIRFNRNDLLAKRIIFNAPCFTLRYCSLKNVAIDAFSYMAGFSQLHNTKIGRYCSLGSRIKTGALLQDSPVTCNASLFQDGLDFDFAGVNLGSDATKSHPQPKYNVIEIGHDVWIGDKVTIAGSVKIGTGAVIGATSVITKDVPPYAIVIGQDRILRSRFKDEVVADLLASQWWNYNIPAMHHNGVELPYDKPQLLLQTLKDLDPEQLVPIQDNWLAFDVPEHEDLVTDLTIHPISAAQVYSFFDEFRS